jgi:S-adenosylmethionine:tRNA ribosyltransferase-isomerase
MQADFFDYDLPPDLIAQAPCPERDLCRLLVVRRATQSLEHRTFNELPDLLNPGDLLVLNDTRVVPARLVGRRARTGGRWEGLFLRELPDRSWEILSKSRGRLLVGEKLQVEPGPLQLELVKKTEDGHWLVRPVVEDASPSSAFDLLERHGQVPLPPYIRKGVAEAADRERYQTVYARRAGAVAAPTAGFHFTPQLFDRLQKRGIGWTFLTLHVGLGTFQPIQTADVSKHMMHREWGELTSEAAEAIAACKSRRGKVIAVGTTGVRVLETVAASGAIRPWRGETDLYIFPPFAFRVVDALITNFHLPRTTLLLLVSAFGGTCLMKQAYQAAIEKRYRFFSYGDAMLIL